MKSHPCSQPLRASPLCVSVCTFRSPPFTAGHSANCEGGGEYALGATVLWSRGLTQNSRIRYELVMWSGREESRPCRACLREESGCRKGNNPPLYGTGEAAPGKQAPVASLRTQAMWTEKEAVRCICSWRKWPRGERLKSLMGFPSSPSEGPLTDGGPTGWPTVWGLCVLEVGGSATSGSVVPVPSRVLCPLFFMLCPPLWTLSFSGFWNLSYLWAFIPLPPAWQLYPASTFRHRPQCHSCTSTPWPPGRWGPPATCIPDTCISLAPLVSPWWLAECVPLR